MVHSNCGSVGILGARVGSMWSPLCTEKGCCAVGYNCPGLVAESEFAGSSLSKKELQLVGVELVLAGIIVPVWNAFWALRKFSPC